MGKDIADIKVCVCGCGAAGFTVAKYFVTLGVRKENVLAVDVKVRIAICLTLPGARERLWRLVQVIKAELSDATKIGEVLEAT